jgi:two-component system LytT family response regulator
VIFISGYKEFEKEAFEFNAIDYVVKPIDISRLKEAVNKATNKIIS